MPINKDVDQDSCYLAQAINYFRRSEAGRHFRNARREMLLTVKSVIDLCLERLEEKTPEEKEGNQAHRVEIK